MHLFFLLRKLTWIFLFKICHPRSPFFIATSFEHRHLKAISLTPKLIFDIGYNKGQFSSLALEIWPDSIVVGFDPHPFCSNKSTFFLRLLYPKRFKFHRTLLDSSPKIRDFNIAISNDNSSALLPTSLNNSLFGRTRIKSKVSLHSRTLSSFDVFNDSAYPVFLKIDVQGSELDVLKGIRSEHYKLIKWIYVEVTDLPLYDGQASASIIEKYLFHKGFVKHSSHNLNFQGNELLYADVLFYRSG